MGLHVRSEGSPTLTIDFAKYVTDTNFDQLSPGVIHAAKRGLLDWIGCALAASKHKTLDLLIETLKEEGVSKQATVIGRQLKLSHIQAALVNGQMGHLLDFDDTHMGGVVLHASSPTLSAILSESERSQHSGAQFLLAYVCGFEAAVRVGQSSPSHHAGGWHLTGTLGHFASSVAVGRLIGLSADQMVHAMGIGATQASGMQQNRGTMCKSFHAGRAASNGILAARLAKNGFNSSDEIVEGKRGFSKIYSVDSKPKRMVEGFGESWEIERNGYKPYACGVVLHPAIDVMIQAHRCGRIELDAKRIKRIEVWVNPLVISITGTVAPTSGLHSKFSIYHSVCVAFIDGKAGIEQYSDARANDPKVLSMKERVSITGDDSLGRDQARVLIEHDAGVDEFFIDHASGTVDNPMSDQALVDKFLGNAAFYLTPAKAKEVVDLVWRFDELEDASVLMSLLA